MVWGVFWGGEGEGLAVITFLIVRSWWFICMKWQTCSYACHCLRGFAGGVGRGAVITFLIVHPWWFMYMKLYTMIYVFLMKWHMCVATLCTLRGTWVDTFAATLYAFAVSSSYFMYVKWQKCWYTFHSWGFIYFACFGYKRTWWRLY